jgi:hypothetical protein
MAQSYADRRRIEGTADSSMHWSLPVQAGFYYVNPADAAPAVPGMGGFEMNMMDPKQMFYERQEEMFASTSQQRSQFPDESHKAWVAKGHSHTEARQKSGTMPPSDPPRDRKLHMKNGRLHFVDRTRPTASAVRFTEKSSGLIIPHDEPQHVEMPGQFLAINPRTQMYEISQCPVGTSPVDCKCARREPYIGGGPTAISEVEYHHPKMHWGRADGVEASKYAGRTIK